MHYPGTLLSVRGKCLSDYQNVFHITVTQSLSEQPLFISKNEKNYVEKPITYDSMYPWTEKGLTPYETISLMKNHTYEKDLESTALNIRTRNPLLSIEEIKKQLQPLNVPYLWNNSTLIPPVKPEYGKLKEYSPCTWSNKGYPYKPDFGPVGETQVNAINLLNSCNFTYIVYQGVGIGIYRHGGPIRGDPDLDIILPVWMNNIATCDDALHKPFPILRGNSSDRGGRTLCGKQRDEYVRLAYQLFKTEIPRRCPPFRGIHVSIGDFGGLLISGRNVMKIDLVISLRDRLYEELGPICRAMFKGDQVLTLERINISQQRFYGTKVMIPNRLNAITQ
ncbi:hypothetical protein WA158_002820 [Blastocystis sp. Blastoise]